MIPPQRKNPEYLLILLGVAATLAFSVWQVLLNNFAIEAAAFTGREIGILQSLREVPGFLAFTTVFILLILREQVFALLAIAVLGVGVALTGFLPSEYGLYFTTVLMSTGFHYFYTAGFCRGLGRNGLLWLRVPGAVPGGWWNCIAAGDSCSGSVPIFFHKKCHKENTC